MLTAASGCDSTITLNLTVNQPTSSTDTQTACSSYTLNGITYTSSGIYTQTLTNAAGCDSTITLDLTVIQPTSSTDTQTACSSYTLNGVTYTSSGIYTQMLANAAGCDSAITLNLTITKPTSSTVTQSTCSAYTLNGITYTSSGVYTQTLTNTAGCDSILTLNLNVDSLDTSVTQNGPSLTANNNSVGVTYQWIDCSTGYYIVGATGQTYVAKSTGSYKVMVRKGNCSSLSLCYSVSKKGGDVSVFPNPSKGAFAIRLPATYPKIKIELYNTNGRLISRRQEVNTNIISFNEVLRSGVYHVHIHAGGIDLITKVVIVK